MKYISQEAAIENAIAQMRISKSEECMRERLLNLETIDVREVKRGRWITKPYMMGNTQYCSCCDENYGRKYNYCPNCGADMREKI